MSKKKEFYERQEQREADKPEIKDGFSFIDEETYDSLPLTRWLNKSGKPIEDHPDIPTELQETIIVKRQSGVPVEILFKSKIVRELIEVETGKATVGQDLMRLLEKLADDKPVVSTRRNYEPEITIMRTKEILSDENSLKIGEPENKEVVRRLVENIPEDILRQTTLRRKKVSLKEEVEQLGLDQESGEWLPQEKEGEEEKSSEKSEDWDEDSVESDGERDSLCAILADQKRRYHDRKLQTDTSSGTYNF